MVISEDQTLGLSHDFTDLIHDRFHIQSKQEKESTEELLWTNFSLTLESDDKGWFWCIFFK